MIIYGKNSVLEAMKNRPKKINKLLISNTAGKGVGGNTIQEIIQLARMSRVIYQFVPKEKLNALARGGNHQGVIVILIASEAKEYVSLESLIEKAKSETIALPIICLLDKITDPQNFGGILRNACFFGIIGVVITKRNSSGITDTVAKVSAGAVEYIPVAQVSNLSYAMEMLKKSGFWIVGTDSSSGEPIGEFSNRWKEKLPVAVVLGSEGTGMGRLIREKCDFLVNIPIICAGGTARILEEGAPVAANPAAGGPRVNSLNVASASAILFYELTKNKNVKI